MNKKNIAEPRFVSRFVEKSDSFGVRTFVPILHPSVASVSEPGAGFDPYAKPHGRELRLRYSKPR